MKWIRRFIIDPLEFIPIFVFYLFFRMLPLSLSSFCGGWIAKTFGPFLPVHRVGQSNIERAFPEKSSKERKDLLKMAWNNLGRVVGEFPHLKKIAAHHVTIVDHCDLHMLLSKEKPIVFFSAHMANWEIPHVVLTLHQMPISLLSRPPNNWITRAFFQWVRSDPLVSIILKGSEGAKDLLKVFQSKGTLGILLDQRLSEGEKIPFFGHDAYTPVGPQRLAHRFQALLIPVQVERLQGVYFRITYHAPLVLEQDPRKTALTVNQTFEIWIREQPAQWLWFHHRWK